MKQSSTWTPEEIAKQIGMSHRWVNTYISDKYKRSGGYRQIAKHAIEENVIGQRQIVEPRSVEVEPHAQKDY